MERKGVGAWVGTAPVNVFAVVVERIPSKLSKGMEQMQFYYL